MAKNECQDRSRGLEPPTGRPRQYATNVAKRRSIKKSSTSHHLLGNVRMRAGSLDSLALKTEIEQIRCNVDKLDNEVSGLSKDISIIAEDIKTTLRYVSQMSMAYSSTTSCGGQSIGDASSSYMSNPNSPADDRSNDGRIVPLIARSQSHSAAINSMSSKAICRSNDHHVHSPDITCKQPEDASDIILPAISIEPPSSTNKHDNQSIKENDTKLSDSLSGNIGEPKRASIPQGRRRRGGIVNLEALSSQENDGRRFSDSHFVNIE